MRRLVRAGALAGTLALLLFGCQKQDQPAPSPAKTGEQAKARPPLRRPTLPVGDPAPDIVGEDTDGKLFKLSDYRGKVVLLDFWGGF